MDSRRCWILLLLMLSSVVPSTCMNVLLQPSDTTVEQGEFAVFTCSYSCAVMQTHTLSWLVGDLPVIQRTFVRGRTSRFIEQSGLYVEVTNQSTCESIDPEQGQAMEQLRINGSALLHERTAIQCVAFPTHPDDFSFYSPYSVMQIKAPSMEDILASSLLPSPTVTSTTIQQEMCPTPVMSPSCPTPATHTIVKTVVREIRITPTVFPTCLPDLEGFDGMNGKEGVNCIASMPRSSLLPTTPLTSLVVTALILSLLL